MTALGLVCGHGHGHSPAHCYQCDNLHPRRQNRHPHQDFAFVGELPVAILFRLMPHVRDRICPTRTELFDFADGCATDE